MRNPAIRSGRATGSGQAKRAKLYGFALFFDLYVWPELPDQEFIASKKSLLFFEVLSLSIRNSMASTVPI